MTEPTIWTLGAGAAVVLDDARRFGLAPPIGVDVNASRVYIHVAIGHLAAWAEYLEAAVTDSQPDYSPGTIHHHATANVFDVPVELVAVTFVSEQVPA